jgi:hypothetical protein
VGTFLDVRHGDCLISRTDTDADALSSRSTWGPGEVLLMKHRSLAAYTARMLGATVGVGGASPPGSILGSLESSGGAELIIGSNADYENRS